MTKAAFARSLNVPPSTITEACKAGRLLAPAFTGVGRAGRVDPSHPAAKDYAKRHADNPPIARAESKGAKPGRPKKGEAASRDRQRWERAAAKSSTTATAKTVVAQVKGKRKPRKTKTDTRSPEERALDELGYVPVSVIEEKIAHAPEPIRAALDMTVRQVLVKYGSMGDFVEVLKATKTIADIDERRMRTAERRGDLIEREHVRIHVFGAIADHDRRLLADTPRTIATRARGLIESGESDEALEAVVRGLIEKQLRGMKARVTKALAVGKGRSTDVDEEFAA